MKDISITDDVLDSRDVEARIDFLRIGNDFLPEDVTADELRKWLNSEIAFGDGDESAGDAAVTHIRGTKDLDDLETMCESIGFFSDALHMAGAPDDADAAEWFEGLSEAEQRGALGIIQKYIIDGLNTDPDRIAFCEQFDVEYQRWFDGVTDDVDELEELADWLDLREQAEAYNMEWGRGAALISADHWATYCQELAEDIGAIPKDVTWPCNHIDWEAAAEELKSDYTELEVAGQSFWIRNT
ncbi:hypothetical protein [Uliginosibacterium gangwonense]|uniref:hypothetical protein n=1 Tax=Uliginosibacterium gangwonense TaxID=392736 RepID=UPI0003799CC2|nr:hypothetical protein [Uliginosibacterium gangwonense]